MKSIILMNSLSNDELKLIIGGYIDSRQCTCNLKGRATTPSGFSDADINLTFSEQQSLHNCDSVETCLSTCESICQAHQSGGANQVCYKYIANYLSNGTGYNLS